MALNHLHLSSIAFPARPGLIIKAYDFALPDLVQETIDVTTTTDTTKKNAPGQVLNAGEVAMTLQYDPAQDFSAVLGQTEEQIEVTLPDGNILAASGFFVSHGGMQAKANTRADRKVSFVINGELLLNPVATPVITLAGSSASITCATSGATIRYTLDGSDPTASSTVYSSAVTLTSGQTIKARGFKSGMSPSLVASVTYTAGSFLGLLAMDGAANNPPYQDQTSGFAQLTTGNWPNSSPTNVNDAVFFKVPSTTKMGAVVGGGLNGNAAATAIVHSDTSGLAGWTQISAYTPYFYTANAIATPVASGKTVHVFDDQLIEITYDGLSLPSTWRRSTDGGANWTSFGTCGSGWSNSISKSYRVHARGAFIAIMQVPPGGGSNGTCCVSTDSGTALTPITGLTATVGAIEWDGTTFIVATKPNSTGSYAGPITIYTATSLSGTWTSRQTFTVADTTMGTDCLNLRLVGSYVYGAIKLTSGGWTLYRAISGSLAISNPLTQVHQPGGTTAVSAISTPKLFGDSKLKYVIAGQKYDSSDGATWASSGSAASNSAGQLAAA